MRKSTVGLACVCIFLLAPISCDIPQSITLRGSPGVHLPLGSLTDLVDTKLEDFFNSDKINEMMGGGNGIHIYEYTGIDVTSGVEAYIIQYPIMEMELDLQKYMDNITLDEKNNFAYNIPSDLASLGPFPAGGYHLTRYGPQPVTNTSSPDPLFILELADMAKLVKEVKGGPFGLELDNSPGFKENIQIKIPALGINDYIKGQDDGGKLRFVNSDTSYIFKPQTDLDSGGELRIFVKATGPCSGRIEPKIVFDWETATIDTSGDRVKDTYTIDNSDLKDFLDGNISFKEAKGFIFAGGIEDDITKMSLKEKSASRDLVNSGTLTGRDHPSFSNRFDKPIPQHSLSQDYIDLTSILNASITGPQELEYEILISEMTITEGAESAGGTIFADLVILLPLEFTISTPPDNAQYEDDYAKLGLKDLFPNMGEDDLFQRGGDDNDLFKNLKTVKFTLSKLQNDILGGKLYLSIDAGEMSYLLDFSLPNPSVEFDINSLPLPFIPRFEILLKKDNQSSPALFWSKRKDPGKDNAKFDFHLSIQARTDIDQTISLPWN